MITEKQKKKALKTLKKWSIEQNAQGITIRDNIHDDCPSNEFELGESKGQCDGDGHFMCHECVNFNLENQ